MRLMTSSGKRQPWPAQIEQFSILRRERKKLSQVRLKSHSSNQLRKRGESLGYKEPKTDDFMTAFGRSQSEKHKDGRAYA
jgi:hypothetical protein